MTVRDPAVAHATCRRRRERSEHHADSAMDNRVISHLNRMPFPVQVAGRRLTGGGSAASSEAKREERVRCTRGLGGPQLRRHEAFLLPSRLIPHRHCPRAEFQPAHELQVDPLR